MTLYLSYIFLSFLLISLLIIWYNNIINFNLDKVYLVWQKQDNGVKPWLIQLLENAIIEVPISKEGHDIIIFRHNHNLGIVSFPLWSLSVIWLNPLWHKNTRAESACWSCDSDGPSSSCCCFLGSSSTKSVSTMTGLQRAVVVVAGNGGTTPCEWILPTWSLILSLSIDAWYLKINCTKKLNQIHAARTTILLLCCTDREKMI